MGDTHARVTQPAAHPLRACPVPLLEAYDLLMADLDGVVYVGQAAVPGAATALEKARAAGLALTFVTNNASRTPEAIAAHLTALGVQASPDEVVTSGQAAARLLADRLPAEAGVFVVGTDALRREVLAAGLRVVNTAEEAPAAVVQGYSPDTTWHDLAEATAAIHRGALWVATNRDITLPSVRGPMPGNGALVNAVRGAVSVEPVVAGKPEPTLQYEAVLRTGARRPLAIGDRLDTDIEGAVRAGYDSLLVLTGVTTPVDLLTATPIRRPTFVAADLEGLLVPHPAVRADDEVWRCGGWQVRASTAGDPHRLDLGGSGDELDALRALCAAVWRAETGIAPQVTASADPGRRLLARWGL